MTLRVLVQSFVLIAAFVASIVAAPPLLAQSYDPGGGSGRSMSSYQPPVPAGEFFISQYPQRLDSGSVCTHRTGTRNAESYDLIPRDSSAPSVPVLAIADGTVVYYGAEKEDLAQGWGYYVLLEHKDGLRSVYAHLNGFLFTPQQQERYTAHRADPAKNGPLTVSAGDAIGIMGSTGVSSGRHLHFSLYNATGRFVDNNILGTPEPAEKHISDFSSAPKELSGSCPEGIALRASGASQAGFSVSGTSGTSSGSVVTVKTGSLGFRILYERVNSLYAFSIGIGGILAFLLIIYAGIRYSLSLGNASKAKEALDQVQAALTGLVLLLALYPILYTVNPCIVDPLRMGDRRDKEGRIVRVPICAVSQLFDARAGTVVSVDAYKNVTAATPAIGSACVGPGSYEQSGGKLSDLAKVLCAGSRSSLPTVGEVHAKLVGTQKNGVAGCTTKDAEEVLKLMRADASCARRGESGGVVGEVVITRSTVHAQVCSELGERGGLQGDVFDPPDEVKKTYAGFAKQISGDPQKKSEDLVRVVNNVPALVAYCKAQSAAPKWCSNQVGVALETKAPLELKNLTPEQEHLLVNVCADLGGFGSPKKYSSASVSAPVATPSAPSSGSSPAAWDWSVGFTDENGRPVLHAVKGQTLNLTAKTGPQTEEVFFEIWEGDFSIVNNEQIRTLALKNAIKGEVGSDGIARGKWTIEQADLKKGGDNFGDLDFLLSARTESGNKKSPFITPKAGVVSVAVSEKNKPEVPFGPPAPVFGPPAPAPTPEPTPASQSQ